VAARDALCSLLHAGQVVILNNARFHRKKAVERILKKVGCRALFLPPYSPDLNLIENQWHSFKTRVRTHRMHGMSSKDAVDTAIT
jgi:transposase